MTATDSWHLDIAWNPYHCCARCATCLASGQLAGARQRDVYVTDFGNIAATKWFCVRCMTELVRMRELSAHMSAVMSSEKESTVKKERP